MWRNEFEVLLIWEELFKISIINTSLITDPTYYVTWRRKWEYVAAEKVSSSKMMSAVNSLLNNEHSISSHAGLSRDTPVPKH